MRTSVQNHLSVTLKTYIFNNASQICIIKNDANRNKWCILGGFIWCTRVPAVAQETEQADHKLSTWWSDPRFLRWKCRSVLGQKTGP